MNLRLLNQARTCHEVGVCQRTTPQCRRVCHMADPDRNGPPIGYEAARPSNVHQLRAEYEANLRAEMAARGISSDVAKDQPAGIWAQPSNALTVVTGICLFLALLGLLYPGTANPELLWQDLKQAFRTALEFFAAIGYGAMRVAG